MQGRQKAGTYVDNPLKTPLPSDMYYSIRIMPIQHNIFSKAVKIFRNSLSLYGIPVFGWRHICISLKYGTEIPRIAKIQYFRYFAYAHIGIVQQSFGAVCFYVKYKIVYGYAGYFFENIGNICFVEENIIGNGFK